MCACELGLRGLPCVPVSKVCEVCEECAMCGPPAAVEQLRVRVACQVRQPWQAHASALAMMYATNVGLAKSFTQVCLNSIRNAKEIPGVLAGEAYRPTPRWLVGSLRLRVGLTASVHASSPNSAGLSRPTGWVGPGSQRLLGRWQSDAGSDAVR
jgi:hypothetical protein